MNWLWVYLDKEGMPTQGLPESAATNEFPTQSDAETYIGAEWQALLDAGVDSVSLYEGDRLVYGPMSIHPES